MATILIVGPAYPLRGGIANLNETLALKLEQKNHQVEIISFYYQYPSFLFPGKSQTENVDEIPTLSIKNLISSVNPISWIKTARYINSRQPDLIVFRYWLPFMAPALGSIARLIKKGRKIAVVDNIIPHEKRPGDHLLTRWFCSSMNGFLAMSKNVLEDISKFTDNQNKVFSPHPVYDMYGEILSIKEARERIQLDVNDRIILFFGFIRKYKGLLLLLQSMDNPEIRKRNIKLLIAGEFYDQKNEYIDYIKTHNLEHMVFIHDHFIDRHRVNAYFCAADLIVQPYIQATQSGVTQIAYHFNKPMLVTNVGGLSEIVSHMKNGYVVEVKESSIRNALIDFYDNDRNNEFSEHTKLWKKKFEWDFFIENLFTLSGLK